MSETRRFNPNGATFALGTRAQFAPSPNMLNVSLDFNAAPSGTARGTEVIIPDDASPEVRAAAQAYNDAVVAFARQAGIENYPNRGVKTRSENGRGVAHTVHTEPFFNSDSAMQQAIQSNPEAFAAIYRDTFGGLSNARVISPHGVGSDRGATSDIFGTETDFGNLMLNTILGGELSPQVQAALPQPQDQSAARYAPAQRNQVAPRGVFEQAYERTAEPSDAPIPLSRQDRMAYVGQALQSLGQGQIAAPPPTEGSGRQPIEITELFGGLRNNPMFQPRKRGLSL